jgi:hypothetical protein
VDLTNSLKRFFFSPIFYKRGGFPKTSAFGTASVFIKKLQNLQANPRLANPRLANRA